MKKTALLGLVLSGALAFSTPTLAEDYVIDTQGAHAFIQFKIPHLGYSWLIGEFNTFGGDFSYDENNPEASKVHVKIDTTSIDSNHAERDKHLRSADFLEVNKYPEAEFVSTEFKDLGNGKAAMRGQPTLKGVTRDVEVAVNHVGAGPDPWGGYRRGFEGTLKIALKDYGINTDLGSLPKEVELKLYVEGIRS
jgi:polyisoprenoid-binding protein YceI